MQKRRRLKAGVARWLRIISVFAIVMQVVVITMILAWIAMCAFSNTVEFMDAMFGCGGLMLYLIWYGVYETANELLQYD